MVSPANSPAVLIKIQLGEDQKAPSFVFQFTADSAKEDQGTNIFEVATGNNVFGRTFSYLQRIVVANFTKISTIASSEGG